MRIPPNERLSAETTGNGPERTCILSGEHAARDCLTRLAISPPGPDGACMLLPDVHARAPGRGAWIGVCREELEKAQANGKLKGVLSRAFGKVLDGAKLNVPEDLGDRIESALLRAFLDRIGLEMRAGNLLLGSERIAEAARAGAVEWLAHASDASEDGSRKLDQALRVGLGREGSGFSGCVLPLDRAALSVALGRDNVVHLALTDPASAHRVGALLQRLLHFQGRTEANVNEDCAREAVDGRPLATAAGHDGRPEAN